jgi:glycosyltransferase involved in cell wall biosynthesis
LTKSSLRIACVDSRPWYSPCLIKSLKDIFPNMVSYIYLPKSTKATVNSAPAEELTVFHVWSKYTYPFDILHKTIKDKVDLVHIQWELNDFGGFSPSLLLPLLLFFLFISRKKTIITIHSVIPRFSFGLKLSGFTLPRGTKVIGELVFLMLYRTVGLLSNGVIVHGDSLKTLLVKDYKARPNKIFVIPYGIPSEAPPNDCNKPDFLMKKNCEVILYIGAISPRKGLHILIEAFQKLSIDHPNWALVIAGNVPSYYQYYYQRLISLSTNLIKRNQIIFLGEYKPSEVHTLMNASKVVVFPYIYNFGASSSLTFALQHKKVVVISSLNFAKDLLTNKDNAVLVSPGNPEFLTKAIECSMEDVALRTTLQKGIIRLLENCSWASVAGKTLEVYERALLNH